MIPTWETEEEENSTHRILQHQGPESKSTLHLSKPSNLIFGLQKLSSEDSYSHTWIGGGGEKRV